MISACRACEVRVEHTDPARSTIMWPHKNELGLRSDRLTQTYIFEQLENIKCHFYDLPGLLVKYLQYINYPNNYHKTLFHILTINPSNALFI